jgi:hypothetical protein
LLVAAASFIYPDKVSYMVGAVLVIATYGVNIIRVRAQR